MVEADSGTVSDAHARAAAFPRAASTSVAPSDANADAARTRSRMRHTGHVIRWNRITKVPLVQHVRALAQLVGASIRAVRAQRHELSFATCYVDRDLSSHATLLGQLERAWAILVNHRPRVVRRMAADVTALRVSRGGGAAYRPTTKECIVGDRLLLEHDSAVVASYIVHEATHARLARTTLRWDLQSRMREERRCYLEQAEFLRSLARAGWKNADAWAIATEQRFQSRFGDQLGMWDAGRQRR